MAAHRDTVVKLINDNQFARVAEIGIWKGELSKQILAKCPCVNNLLLVDPMARSLNVFDNASDGLHPTVMPNGQYECLMGEPAKTDEQLDQVAAGIDSMCKSASVNQRKAAFWRMTSTAAADKARANTFDFVFIDAIHLYENVLEDIAAWLPLVRPGGILAGDDFTSSFPGVIQAVTETVMTMDGFEVISAAGVWTVRV